MLLPDLVEFGLKDHHKSGHSTKVNPSPESFADFHYRLKAELREYRPILERNELETSALGLSFQVKPEHLNPIGLKLECAASIGKEFLYIFCGFCGS